MVFRPGKKSFVASKHLCVCDSCIQFRLEDCPKFHEYQITVTPIQKPITRSEVVEEEEMSFKVSSLVQPGSIFAIKASNAR